MEIVCATDNNFVQHCIIMLISVLSNNENVNIHILTEGLTLANKEKIQKEIQVKGGKVSFYTINSGLLKDLPMPKNKGLSHITIATYYRLLISEILPNSLDKAIYFDCDIIVRKSIKELWNINIDNKAIGAVKQAGYSYHCHRLGYPEIYGYFNAGVLLINLKYWRENNCSKILIKYLNEHFSEVIYHDQDALNYVFHKYCLEISCKWNMTSMYLEGDIKRFVDKGKNGDVINGYLSYKYDLQYERKDPTVVHYVSKPKPWQKHCFSSWQFCYYEYANKTINYTDISYSKIDNMISVFFHNIKRRLYILYIYLKV